MYTFWLTGLPSAGKTTLGNYLLNTLKDQGIYSILIDGDEVRKTLCSDLGFSERDRYENIRRVASMAKLLNDAGYNTICCFVSPSNELRELARTIIGRKNFIEIFIDTPLDECIKRDIKGLYKKAINNQIPEFTGISAPYQIPIKPDIIINNEQLSIEDSGKVLMGKVIEIINRNKNIS